MERLTLILQTQLTVKWALGGGARVGRVTPYDREAYESSMLR
jgi:hypothetical protein